MSSRCLLGGSDAGSLTEVGLSPTLGSDRGDSARLRPQGWPPLCGHRLIETRRRGRCIRGRITDQLIFSVPCAYPCLFSTWCQAPCSYVWDGRAGRARRRCEPLAHTRARSGWPGGSIRRRSGSTTTRASVPPASVRTHDSARPPPWRENSGRRSCVTHQPSGRSGGPWSPRNPCCPTNRSVALPMAILLNCSLCVHRPVYTIAPSGSVHKKRCSPTDVCRRSPPPKSLGARQRAPARKVPLHGGCLTQRGERVFTQGGEHPFTPFSWA